MALRILKTRSEITARVAAYTKDQVELMHQFAERLKEDASVDAAQFLRRVEVIEAQVAELRWVLGEVES